MTQGAHESSGGRGTAGAALRMMGSRRTARLVMAGGVVVSLVALVAALVFTTSGVAVVIFVGVLLLSCALSCLIAWQLSERAARDLDEQVEELARRRGGATGQGSVS